MIFTKQATLFLVSTFGILSVAVRVNRRPEETRLFSQLIRAVAVAAAA